MADIEMRFGKDMLVVSGSLDKTLARQGINIHADRQYLNLFEPELIAETLRLQTIAGARCLVTTSEDITPARLAHVHIQSDGRALAHAAVAIAHELVPEHILAAIGPCDLPLDASSAASLKENKAQYTQAARFFEGVQFDAFLLDGFTSLVDLKCALMGVRQVSDLPIFASVVIGGENEAPQEDAAIPVATPNATRSTAPTSAATIATPTTTSAATDFDLASIRSGLPLDGYQLIDAKAGTTHLTRTRTPLSPKVLESAIDIMLEFGASVVGVETVDPLDRAFIYASTAAAYTSLPIMMSLRTVPDPLGAVQKGLTPLEALECYNADTMPYAAEHLRKAGVQFLRATGMSDAAFTAGLYAATAGMDVVPRTNTRTNTRTSTQAPAHATPVTQAH